MVAFPPSQKEAPQRPNSVAGRGAAGHEERPMARFSIRERVRWSDIDAAQIIFYGSYIRFLEFAESEMFRSAGYPYGQMAERLGIFLPRRHIECDFVSAAKLEDLLDVSCWVDHLGTSSLGISFRVQRDGGELAATARLVLVAVNSESFSRMPLPDELRSALQPFFEAPVSVS